MTTYKSTTDAQAFYNVGENLHREVGAFLKYVEKRKEPLHIYSAFLRMLFPIAESLGDLIYGEDSSTNLYRILSENYVTCNETYKEVAALLICIYRHSLIHTDTLREIYFEDIKISWSLTPNWLTKGHLELTGTSHNRLRFVKGGIEKTGEPYIIHIQFSVKQFYKDTLKVCEQMYKLNKNVNGEIGCRYDHWKTLELKNDTKEKIKKLAIKEIINLMQR
ncbi:MAG: hypothetical protein KGI50_00165 [Patescibacteria group bacterium]|nr:hypothetical protein [Patescibacteria group bacterium]MDE2438224.1 hypothetical protein [Patescibacteria group bacterium]